ncbi:hypothetical protein Hdeb2414_s0011g00365411 [Helianthus debilis subsp. tardiflorus]
MEIKANCWADDLNVEVGWKYVGMITKKTIYTTFLGWSLDLSKRESPRGRATYIWTATARRKKKAFFVWGIF